jgi:hypothetical protein
LGEVEAGGLQVWGHPGLHREAPSLKKFLAGYWWFMPIILATQEVEIKRIAV